MLETAGLWPLGRKKEQLSGSIQQGFLSVKKGREFQLREYPSTQCHCQGEYLFRLPQISARPVKITKIAYKRTFMLFIKFFLEPHNPP